MAQEVRKVAALYQPYPACNALKFLWSCAKRLQLKSLLQSCRTYSSCD
jgi:hypothetical protein